MSTYRTREQYERYHKGTCVRCRRKGASRAAFWEGLICRTCCEKAANTRGTCPECGTDRLLPGRRGQVAICRDCAGITRDFHCDRCGTEAHLLGGRLCERCTLADRLDELLDDGTGKPPPWLTPLHETILAMPRPKSALAWLRGSKARLLLQELASGTLPLTHQAFHRHSEWRAAAHLRDLLMTCGLLPLIDKYLLHHESWLHRRTRELHDQAHLPILEQFATWNQLPKLRTRAERRPLTPSARSHAARQFDRAHEFLTWLERQSLTLEQVGQAEVDHWHAANPLHRQRSLRAFLTWARDTGRLPSRPTFPRLAKTEGPRLTQHRRLELLRRVLDETAGPLRSRAAACLMLLFAQPASRIVLLTTDDLIQDTDGQALIHLGDPPTPVPEPFADLLLRAGKQRTNMNTTNPDAPWLFPGRRAGRPMHPHSLAELIRDIGIPGTAVRTSALRQLVLQAPAPVIAQALGFHDKTTTQVVAEAGGTWNRYAPSDHSQ